MFHLSYLIFFNFAAKIIDMDLDDGGSILGRLLSKHKIDHAVKEII